MGIRETDSYNTAGEGGSNRSSAGEGRPFISSRWLGQLRNTIEEQNEEGRSSWNRLTGPICKSFTDFFTEHLPYFVRGLAAGSHKNLILLLVFLLCAFTVVHYLLQPPGSSLENLVPAPALCSGQDDLYDTATKLCKVGNKYALWYLRNKDWVQCAPNVPGYKLLDGTGPSSSGQYWYPFTQSTIVREFYDTCIPECATDEDTFHVTRDLCMLTDEVLPSSSHVPAQSS